MKYLWYFARESRSLFLSLSLESFESLEYIGYITMIIPFLPSIIAPFVSRLFIRDKGRLGKIRSSRDGEGTVG